MPRAYTLAERDIIISELKQAALDCMAIYGIRKTTVDELVRRAKIPKGTFYLFYSSKESLLFDAFQDLHDSIQEQLIEMLTSLDGQMTVDHVTEAIFVCFCRVEKENLAQILGHGDFDLLLRKIPNEETEAHFIKDRAAMERLSLLMSAGRRSLAVFDGAFRTVFLTLLHRREIGEDYFYDCVKILIRGIVIQMLE